jgi:anaerobic carbon-monoxide dehydrogenase iron sulfur subunit
MKKIIIADPSKCTGCRTCEMVCSVKHEGQSNPSRARVHVVRFEEQTLEVPVMCQQCEDAPCLDACPVKAISRDEIDVVRADRDRCIGCRTCVLVCPFGATGYDPVRKRVFKCDQCEGDPACVQHCETKALSYVEASKVSMMKSREPARKIYELMKKMGPVSRVEDFRTAEGFSGCR